MWAPNSLAVLEVEFVLSALLDRHGQRDLVLVGVPAISAPNCSSTRMPADSRATGSGVSSSARWHALVDHPLGIGDRRRLLRRRLARPRRRTSSGTTPGGRTRGCTAALRSRASWWPSLRCEPRCYSLLGSGPSRRRGRAPGPAPGPRRPRTGRRSSAHRRRSRSAWGRRDRGRIAETRPPASSGPIVNGSPPMQTIATSVAIDSSSGERVGVARVVDGLPAELEQVADPVVLLRMHVQAVLHRVVGGNRREPHAADLVRLPRRDRRHVAGELPGDVVRGDELRRRRESRSISSGWK